MLFSVGDRPNLSWWRNLRAEATFVLPFTTKQGEDWFRVGENVWWILLNMLLVLVLVLVLVLPWLSLKLLF